jgi:hypothetical protein
MPTTFIESQGAIEESTYAVTAVFYDEDDNVVVPNAGLNWSLTKDDRTTIVNSRGTVALTPAGTVTIVLSGNDLVIDAGQLVSWRYLLIEGDYDGALGSGLPIRDHLFFPVLDLAESP